MSTEPWYTNAEIWAVIVSFIALLLSQFPPVLTWFRSPKLRIEIDERFSIGHFLGHPHCQAYLSLLNTGAHPIRVKKIHFKINRPNSDKFELRAQRFFQSPNADSPLMFFPLTLNKGCEWAHLTNGIDSVDENTEQRLNKVVMETQRIYADSISNSQKKLILNPNIYQMANKEFKDFFIWERGEYQVQVIVDTEQGQWSSSKYRFTVFESSVDELREQVNGYITGKGILPFMPVPGVNCRLRNI